MSMNKNKLITVFALFFLVGITIFVNAVTDTVFSDIDNDGDYDIYLETVIENRAGTAFYNRTNASTIPIFPDLIKGHFVDFDGDGREDLYIVINGSVNQLYLRDAAAGNWDFTNYTNSVIGQRLRGEAGSPVAAVFADFTNDNNTDAFVNGELWITTTSNFDFNATNRSNLDEMPDLVWIKAKDVNLDNLIDIIGTTINGKIVVYLSLGDTNNDDAPEFYPAEVDMGLHYETNIVFTEIGNIETGLATNNTLNYYPFVNDTSPFILDKFEDFYLVKTNNTANILYTQLWPILPEKYSKINKSVFYIPELANMQPIGINDTRNGSMAIIADFDNNNVTDILIANHDNTSRIMLRNGSSWSQLFIDSDANFSNSTNIKLIETIDLNNDGELDFAVIDAQLIDLQETQGSGSSVEFPVEEACAGQEFVTGGLTDVPDFREFEEPIEGGPYTSVLFEQELTPITAALDSTNIDFPVIDEFSANPAAFAIIEGDSVGLITEPAGGICLEMSDIGIFLPIAGSKKLDENIPFDEPPIPIPAIPVGGGPGGSTAVPEVDTIDCGILVLGCPSLESMIESITSPEQKKLMKVGEIGVRTKLYDQSWEIPETQTCSKSGRETEIAKKFRFEEIYEGLTISSNIPPVVYFSREQTFQERTFELTGCPASIMGTQLTGLTPNVFADCKKRIFYEINCPEVLTCLDLFGEEYGSIALNKQTIKDKGYTIISGYDFFVNEVQPEAGEFIRLPKPEFFDILEEHDEFIDEEDFDNFIDENFDDFFPDEFCGREEEKCVCCTPAPTYEILRDGNPKLFCIACGEGAAPPPAAAPSSPAPGGPVITHGLTPTPPAATATGTPSTGGSAVTSNFFVDLENIITGAQVAAPAIGPGTGTTVTGTTGSGSTNVAAPASGAPAPGAPVPPVMGPVQEECLKKSDCVKQCLETPCQASNHLIDLLEPYESPEDKWDCEDITVKIQAPEEIESPVKKPKGFCGDGILQGGEECDVGTLTNPNCRCVNCQIVCPDAPIKIYNWYTWQLSDEEEVSTDPDLVLADTAYDSMVDSVEPYSSDEETNFAVDLFVSMASPEDTLTTATAITGAAGAELTRENSLDITATDVAAQGDTLDIAAIREDALNIRVIPANGSVDINDISITDDASDENVLEKLGKLYSIAVVNLNKYIEGVLEKGTKFVYAHYVQDLDAQMEAVNAKIQDANAIAEDIFGIINNLFSLEYDEGGEEVSFSSPFEAKRMIYEKIALISGDFYFDKGFFEDLDILVDYSADYKRLIDVQEKLNKIMEFISEQQPLNEKVKQEIELEFAELSSEINEIKNNMPDIQQYRYGFADVVAEDADVNESDLAVLTKEASIAQTNRDAARARSIAAETAAMTAALAKPGIAAVAADTVTANVTRPDFVAFETGMVSVEPGVVGVEAPPALPPEEEVPVEEPEEKPEKELAPEPVPEEKKKKKKKELTEEEKKSDEYFERGRNQYNREEYFACVENFAQALKLKTRADAMFLLSKSLQYLDYDVLALKTIEPITQIPGWPEAVDEYDKEPVELSEEELEKGVSLVNKKLSNYVQKLQQSEEFTKEQDKIIAPELNILFDVGACIQPGGEFLFEGDVVNFDYIVQRNSEEYFAYCKKKDSGEVLELGLDELRDKLQELGMCEEEVVKVKPEPPLGIPYQEPEEEPEAPAPEFTDDEINDIKNAVDDAISSISGSLRSFAGEIFGCADKTDLSSSLVSKIDASADLTSVSSTKDVLKAGAEDIVLFKHTEFSSREDKAANFVSGLAVSDVNIETDFLSSFLQKEVASADIVSADVNDMIVTDDQVCVPKKDLSDEAQEILERPEQVSKIVENLFVAKKVVDVYELTHDVIIEPFGITGADTSETGTGASSGETDSSGPPAITADVTAEADSDDDVEWDPTTGQVIHSGIIENYKMLYVDVDLELVDFFEKELSEEDWDNLNKVENATGEPVCSFGDTGFADSVSLGAGEVTCRDRDNCEIIEGEIVCDSNEISFDCADADEVEAYAEKKGIAISEAFPDYVRYGGNYVKKVTGKRVSGYGECLSEFDLFGCSKGATGRVYCADYAEGECTQSDISQIITCAHKPMPGCSFIGEEVICDGFDSCEIKDGAIECKNDLEEEEEEPEIPEGCEESDKGYSCQGYLNDACKLVNDVMKCDSRKKIPDNCKLVAGKLTCDDYNIPDECSYKNGVVDCNNNLDCGFGESGVECWPKQKGSLNVPEGCVMEGEELLCVEGIDELSSFPPGCSVVDNELVCYDPIDLPDDCIITKDGLSCEREGYCGFDIEKNVVCVKPEKIVKQGCEQTVDGLICEDYGKGECVWVDKEIVCSEEKTIIPEGCEFGDDNVYCNGVVLNLPANCGVSDNKIICEGLEGDCYYVNNILFCGKETVGDSS